MEDNDNNRREANPTTPTGLIDGRYRLLKRIGSGRLGPVFEAREEEASGAEAGESVALQLLHAPAGEDSDFIDALRRGYATLRAGPHPNLVGLKDFGSEGHTFFLVMELLEGATLEFVLDEVGALPADEALPVIRAAGDALQYLHAKSMVHGRLRPASVFVTDDHRVKLIDLVPAGPPMAVPGAGGDGAAPSAADDVFALACLTYEVVSGGHPYNSVSAAEARRAGLKARRLDALSDREWRALARGLAVEPADRSPSVAAFLTEFGASDRKPAEDRDPEPDNEEGEPGWQAAAAVVGDDIRSDRRADARPRDGRRNGFVAYVWAALAGLIIAGAWVYREPLTEQATALLGGAAQREPVAETADPPPRDERLPMLPPVDRPGVETAAPPVTGPEEQPETDSSTPVLAVREPGNEGSRDEPMPQTADTSPRRISIAESEISRPESAGFVTVLVQRVGDTSDRVGLLWWTSDQTATVGDDYAELGVRRESIEPGDSELGLLIPLVDDGLAEGTEHFLVHVEVIGATSGDERLPAVRVAIADDD